MVVFSEDEGLKEINTRKKWCYFLLDCLAGQCTIIMDKFRGYS